MNYEFPVITHIDPVLKAIEGHDEFIIAKKDGYNVISYMVVKDDTFSHPDKWIESVRRECRGLIFDKTTGMIRRRPFHKFFNVNEREETQSSQFSLDVPYELYHKLDGSMVTPFMNGDNIENIRWATKMGITDVSMMAETFIAGGNWNYHDLAFECIQNNITPIFEWCSEKQKIVLEYPEDRLVLLAARDIYSGRYLGHDEIVDLGERYEVETCGKVDKSSIVDFGSLVNETRNETDREGYVLAFGDGHKVKIKTDWYVRLHKMYDKLRYDRNIAQLIMYDELDDMIPTLLKDQKDRVLEYQNTFWNAFDTKLEYLHNKCREIAIAHSFDRKDIAINIAPGMDKNDRFFMFKYLDDRHFALELMDYLKKKMNTNKMYDETWKWLNENTNTE